VHARCRRRPKTSGPAVSTVAAVPERPNAAYVPPLDDIWFALREIVDLPRLATLPPFTHAEPELLSGVLAEAGRFVAEVVAPLNRVGDEQHSRRNADGTVSTPDERRTYGSSASCSAAG
jgi:hypothetical protein